MLVVATYRPVDAAMNDHPVARIKRRLVRQGAAQELALDLLDESAVGAYLVNRFDGIDPEPELVSAFHDVTDGNPLFMDTLADHLEARSWFDRQEGGMKMGDHVKELRQMTVLSFRDIVDSQLAGMSSDDVEVLEAASVAGESFDAQRVAAVLETDIDTGE